MSVDMVADDMHKKRVPHVDTRHAPQEDMVADADMHKKLPQEDAPETIKTSGDNKSPHETHETPSITRTSARTPAKHTDLEAHGPGMMHMHESVSSGWYKVGGVQGHAHRVSSADTSPPRKTASDIEQLADPEPLESPTADYRCRDQTAHRPYAEVEVYLGPIKRQNRMRVKIAKYLPPYPNSQWPLTAHITDPVRLMIVCSGPAAIMQVPLCPPLSPSASLCLPLPPFPPPALGLPTRVSAHLNREPMPGRRCGYSWRRSTRRACVCAGSRTSSSSPRTRSRMGIVT
jgi:hypothetical protein